MRKTRFTFVTALSVRGSLVLFLVHSLLCAYAKEAGTPRNPFTVKELIQLVSIVNPVASTFAELRESPPRGFPLFSPDRTKFVLITQRGNVSNGNLESTLWMFSRAMVYDYLTGKTNVRPKPKSLATFGAASNTFVMSEVRWLADSERISFLGKSAPNQQQLFIVNVEKGSIDTITKEGAYVSQYAIAADTIVYTTVTEPQQSSVPEKELVDITGKSIYALLFTDRKDIEDEDEWGFHHRPNVLHIMRNGKELTSAFIFDGAPLRLFTPTLSLDPDGETLITVAPVHHLPQEWARYHPAFDHMDYLNLKPDNKYALDEKNPWKASQYISVDIKNGRITPLIAAPAGRVLGYAVPTTAFFLRDGRRVVLTNTFLPVSGPESSTENLRREESPALVMVDLVNHTYGLVGYLSQGVFRSSNFYRVNDVVWNGISEDVTVTYEGGESAHVPPPQRYRYRDSSWSAISTQGAATDDSDTLVLQVHEDLTHPSVLIGNIPGKPTRVIWDPNPQLADLEMGEVAVYRWKSRDGSLRSGILALPPDFQKGHPYPLVIQTHGQSPGRFFADGEFTTGSGGRALNALGFVVLQMDMPMLHFTTPQDGPFELAGFEGAIDQLSNEGVIDRERVGVIGFSYSCFHVLYAMTHSPDLFAAATITDGNNVSYLQYILSTDDHGALQEISEKTNGGKPFSENLVSWSHLAPNFGLDKARTPLLISSFETGELLAQWETYAGMRTLGKPVDMVWLRKENAPHVLIKPQERYMSQQMAVDWFDFWLNKHEDRDLSKEDQYRRWRDLQQLVKSNIGPQPTPSVQ